MDCGSNYAVRHVRNNEFTDVEASEYEYSYRTGWLLCVMVDGMDSVAEYDMGGGNADGHDDGIFNFRIGVLLILLLNWVHR